jgi:hypothetical protein
LHTKMLVLAMKFSSNAGEQGSHREDAPKAPRTGTAAHLHNGRQDGYQRLERTWCERAVPEHQTSASTGCPDSTRNERP